MHDDTPAGVQGDTGQWLSFIYAMMLASEVFPFRYCYFLYLGSLVQACVSGGVWDGAAGEVRGGEHQRGGGAQVQGTEQTGVRGHAQAEVRHQGGGLYCKYDNIV